MSVRCIFVSDIWIKYLLSLFIWKIFKHSSVSHYQHTCIFIDDKQIFSAIKSEDDRNIAKHVFKLYLFLISSYFPINC